MEKITGKRYSWDEIEVGEFYMVSADWRSESFYILERDDDDIIVVDTQGFEIWHLAGRRTRIDAGDITVRNHRDMYKDKTHRERQRRLVESIFKNFGRKIGHPV